MINLNTTVLLTWEVSIDHASHKCVFYYCSYSMGSGLDWKQNMLKVSKKDRCANKLESVIFSKEMCLFQTRTYSKEETPLN